MNRLDNVHHEEKDSFHELEESPQRRSFSSNQQFKRKRQDFGDCEMGLLNNSESRQRNSSPAFFVKESKKDDPNYDDFVDNEKEAYQSRKISKRKANKEVSKQFQKNHPRESGQKFYPSNDYDYNYRGPCSHYEKNLDVYFKNMYKYYRVKGFSSFIATSVTTLISMFFTIVLSTFLLAFVDWSTLMACKSEETCATFSAYITDGGINDLGRELFTLRYGTVYLYFLLFSFYWLVTLCSFFSEIIDMSHMKEVYEYHLGIRENDLYQSRIDFDTVIFLLNEKHKEGKYRITPFESQLNPIYISHRIMRKENYLIALLRETDLIDFHLDFESISRHFSSNATQLNEQIGSSYVAIQDNDNDGKSYSTSAMSKKTKNSLYSKHLEWCIYTFILSGFLTKDFKLYRPFIQNKKGLKQTLRRNGFLQLIIFPFVLVFMIMQFFLSNAQEWHSKKNYLGPRQWSPLAFLLFREYNELPHALDKRLCVAYPYALEFVKKDPHPIVSISANCASYITGSIVAVLLLFTLLEESILLYVTVWDRNLLWFIGIFSAIFVTCRGFVPDEKESAKNQEKLMQDLHIQRNPSRGTQYCENEHDIKRAEWLANVNKNLYYDSKYIPHHWVTSPCCEETRRDLLNVFKYKATLFYNEIISALLCPFILVFVLPKRADHILRFIEQNTTEISGIGYVCSHSVNLKESNEFDDTDQIEDEILFRNDSSIDTSEEISKSLAPENNANDMYVSDNNPSEITNSNIQKNSNIKEFPINNISSTCTQKFKNQKSKSLDLPDNSYINMSFIKNQKDPNDVGNYMIDNREEPENNTYYKFVDQCEEDKINKHTIKNDRAQYLHGMSNNHINFEDKVPCNETHQNNTITDTSNSQNDLDVIKTTDKEIHKAPHGGKRGEIYDNRKPNKSNKTTVFQTLNEELETAKDLFLQNSVSSSMSSSSPLPNFSSFSASNMESSSDSSIRRNEKK